MSRFIVKSLLLATFVFAQINVYCQTKVMTYNIRFATPSDGENSWSQRKYELIQLIDYYDPAIFGIQEGINAQLESIKESLSDYDYVGVGRDDGKQKGEYSAIFYDQTQFKLLETQTYWLSPTPNEVSVGWDAAMERVTTYGAFENLLTHDTLHVFNCHYDHIGETARKKSSELILDLMGQYQLEAKKVIVMGDFNAQRQEGPLMILTTQLDDSYEISSTKTYGPQGTFTGFERCKIPEVRIDYILTKNLRIKNHRHIDDKRANGLCVSDHLPVLVEIEP